jgi:ankyrin repeat protein
MNEKLIQTVSQNNMEDTKELLKKGADVNFIEIETKTTPLLIAVSNFYLDMAKLLLENGANPNPDSNSVYTLPLNEAIDSAVQMMLYDESMEKYPTEMIELLLNYKADILMKDKDGHSAYDFAKDYHPEACKLFEDILKK